MNGTPCRFDHEFLQVDDCLRNFQLSHAGRQEKTEAFQARKTWSWRKESNLRLTDYESPYFQPMLVSLIIYAIDGQARGDGCIRGTA